MKNRLRTMAFSLPEIIIVMLIVAIAALLFITTLRPNSDKLVLKKLYYNAYRTLSTATYNIQADVEDYNNKLVEEADAAGSGEPAENELRSFPSTQAELCEKLISNEEGYINISGVAACSKVVQANSEQQFKDKTGAELKEMATFTASNGMYYFMSEMDADGNSIIWVDLTGDRAPNTAIWKKEAPADIVPFMIANNGIVVPLGYPTYDIRYLTARITNSDPDVTRDSQIMSFYGAKVGAFNNKSYKLEPLSWADPITMSNTEITQMVHNATADPNCEDRQDTEFPACTVLVEEQIRR